MENVSFHPYILEILKLCEVTPRDDLKFDQGGNPN